MSSETACTVKRTNGVAIAAANAWLSKVKKYGKYMTWMTCQNPEEVDSKEANIRRIQCGISAYTCWQTYIQATIYLEYRLDCPDLIEKRNVIYANLRKAVICMYVAGKDLYYFSEVPHDYRDGFRLNGPCPRPIHYDDYCTTIKEFRAS